MMFQKAFGDEFQNGGGGVIKDKTKYKLLVNEVKNIIERYCCCFQFLKRDNF